MPDRPVKIGRGKLSMYQSTGIMEQEYKTQERTREKFDYKHKIKK